jgi:predicted MFS family arabinose efflux permease
VPGILVAVLTGPYSDRFGRKRFLFAGSLIMGIFTLLSAFATSFAVLVAMRVLAGIGSSVIFPNVTATVGDNFTYRERGSAMGVVIGLNTLAGVIGVPLAGVLAEATSWRVSVGLVGVLSIAAAMLLFWKLRPAQTPLSASRIRDLYRSIVTNRSALGAIGSSFLGALYWFTWATYIVVFFQDAFGLSQGVASVLALTQGLGVMVGSQLGGRLGGRIGHKPIVAGSVLLSAALLLFQTNVTLPLAATAFLNLVLSAVIGARFASNTTLLTEQVPEARGTLLAVSASVTSASIVVGATIGGLLVDGPGFWALGAFCAAAGVLAALVVWIFVREEPIDLEIAPAV